MEDLIYSLRGQLTLLMVTHNLAQARRIIYYVGMFWAQLGSGQLIEQGSTSQIFEDPQHPVTAAFIQGARG